jgi:dipeptidyl aminopeptidase/acylaminoacyl peptidase
MFLNLLIVSMTAHAQNLSWRYAFAVATLSGVTIYALDPANPASATAIFSVPAIHPTPSLEQLGSLPLSQMMPSPNGQWLALIYSRQNFGLQLNLVEISTGNIREVFISDLDSPMVDKLAWSPDSQWIAFTGSFEAGWYEDLYIYNVQTQAMQHLLSHTYGFPVHFVWSADSEKIALYSVDVTTISCLSCPGYLSVYTVETSDFQIVADLSVPASLTNAGPAEELCNLQWSPDQRYVSFVIGCGSIFPYHKELYLVEITQHTLQSLTPYTSQTGDADSNRQSDYSANYQTAWFDGNHLLVSMSIRQFFWPISQPRPTPPPLIIESVVYKFPEQTKTSMIPNANVIEWDINPAAGKVAFTTIAETDGTTQPVKIASFDGQSLNVTITGPAGCNLDWSPDGVTLAYSDVGIRPRYACTDPLHYIFVSAETAAVSQYVVPSDAKVITIGWVAASLHENS